MALRLGQFGKELQESVFIRRGGVVFGGQGGGYKVALNENGSPKSFQSLIDISSQSSRFIPYIQTNENKYSAMFIPILRTFILEDESTPTTLQRGDQLARANYIERTPKQGSESDSDHLLRDIKNSKTGILTVSDIEQKLNVMFIYLEDKTEQIS